MKKFINKDNLNTFWDKVDSKKQDKLPDGTPGQVLTKTEDSVEWADIQEGITNEDVENTINEALYESSVEYVDLGLPSGLLWATCNLGAKTETESGLYFQWGDTKGYKDACEESESDGNEAAHYFNWSKYKYCEGTDSTITKYCTYQSYGVVDGKAVLESEDDAATVMLGGQWRTPSEEEFVELIDNTVPGDGTNEYGWIKNYNGTGVNGLLLKSRTNDNTIFFPSSGGGTNNAIGDVGMAGYYWSSSIFGNKASDAFYYYFNNNDLNSSGNSRYRGLSVRGVTSSISRTKPKFQPRLPNGEVGQVLTKTNDGVEWKTQSGANELKVIKISLTGSENKISREIEPYGENNYDGIKTGDDVIVEIYEKGELLETSKGTIVESEEYYIQIYTQERLNIAHYFLCTVPIPEEYENELFSCVVYSYLLEEHIANEYYIKRPKEEPKLEYNDDRYVLTIDKYGYTKWERPFNYNNKVNILSTNGLYMNYLAYQINYLTGVGSEISSYYSAIPIDTLNGKDVHIIIEPLSNTANISIPKTIDMLSVIKGYDVISDTDLLEIEPDEIGEINVIRIDHKLYIKTLVYSKA